MVIFRRSTRDSQFSARNMWLKTAAFGLMLATGMAVSGISAQEVPRREFHLLGIPDPTIIRAGDGSGYYIVCSGKGIPIWRSRDLREWTQVGRVFSDDVPSWARRKIPDSRGVWAPDIKRVNGKYFVYYSVSTPGSQRSVIGLAVNASLDPSAPDYRWEDRGLILESDPDATTFNAIDPALLVDDKDGMFLFWGSYWDGIKAGRIDGESGRLVSPATEATAVARRGKNAAPAIEGAYPIKRNGFYYLFVSWDHCFADNPSDISYKVMVGRSKKPLGPYVDRLGKPMTAGGGELVVMGDRRWRGPGHNSVLQTPSQDWLVHHVTDATQPRAGRLLQIRPLAWHNGWPVAGTPLGSRNDPPAGTFAARVVGRWDHVVNGHNHYDIFLEANGLISGTPGLAHWQIAHDTMLLKWKSPKAPGGFWIDRVKLDAAGRSYVGRNGKGTVIRGRKRVAEHRGDTE